MKYVWALLAAAFLIFMVPSFKVMWDSWIPGLVESTPDLPVFLTFLVTYWPWLFALFIAAIIFLVIRGKSGSS